MLTFLASAGSVLCQALVEEPIKDTGSQDEIGEWVHRLAVTLMILFINGQISYKVAVASKEPAFTYGQMLLNIKYAHAPWGAI